ncbi:arginine-glutamic acid dipeptide repeats protein-like [Macrobrachium nipponense]|uniref:arginine-glutamic acid dipeptide repeats protein-like n=1 Tax=Macrobrachium nipponense TaxID=159736 RepID=UPI0030C7E0DA
MGAEFISSNSTYHPPPPPHPPPYPTSHTPYLALTQTPHTSSMHYIPYPNSHIAYYPYPTPHTTLHHRTPYLKHPHLPTPPHPTLPHPTHPHHPHTTSLHNPHPRPPPPHPTAHNIPIPHHSTPNPNPNPTPDPGIATLQSKSVRHFQPFRALDSEKTELERLDSEIAGRKWGRRKFGSISVLEVKEEETGRIKQRFTEITTDTVRTPTKENAQTGKPQVLMKYGYWLKNFKAPTPTNSRTTPALYNLADYNKPQRIIEPQDPGVIYEFRFHLQVLNCNIQRITATEPLPPVSPEHKTQSGPVLVTLENK